MGKFPCTDQLWMIQPAGSKHVIIFAPLQAMGRDQTPSGSKWKRSFIPQRLSGMVIWEILSVKQVSSHSVIEAVMVWTLLKVATELL